jgi:arsenate reductase-like glutaredoxin family protein
MVRPILTDGQHLVIGFKEDEYKAFLSKSNKTTP